MLELNNIVISVHGMQEEQREEGRLEEEKERETLITEGFICGLL